MRRSGTTGAHSGTSGKKTILLLLTAAILLSACTVESITGPGRNAAENTTEPEGVLVADGTDATEEPAAEEGQAAEEPSTEEETQTPDTTAEMLAKRAGNLFRKDPDGRVSKAYVDETELDEKNSDNEKPASKKSETETSDVVYSNGIGPVSVSGNSAAGGVSANDGADTKGTSADGKKVESTASGKKTETGKTGAEDEEPPYVEPTGERRRRTLPQAEPGKTSESGKADIPARKKPEVYEGASVMFIEKKRVGEKKITASDSSFPTSEQDVQTILGNLASFWEAYNMEAVDYLIRMDKYRYLSQLLEGTNEYFYFGETGKDGEPNGRGLACYANNQYYYGDFKDGLRSGNGYWYQIFVRGGAYCRENNGIYSHTYHGEWAEDYPNGNGQEHLDIDPQYLQERIATNVIGSFKNGYYHGDEIVTTLTPGDTNLLNWRGTAVEGEWIAAGGNYGMLPDGTILNIAALETAEDVNEVPDRYFWMLAKENIGQGITGLIRE